MRQLNKINLLLLFTVANFFVQAQNTERTETKDIWLSITAIQQTGDTVYAFLDIPADLRLKNGLLLKAFQLSTPAIAGVKPKREFAEIGSGLILQNDTLTMAFIKLYKSVDTLQEGDLISIRLAVPYLAYRSIFSDMVFQNLLFKDDYREPIYTFNDVLEKDSRLFEDSVYTVLVNTLHNTYELVKNNEGLPPFMQKKLDKGRFKGKAPLEILRDVSRKDLEAFFYYINDYPVGYMGKNYRLSESFSGWLVSNSPYSVGEIKRGLFPYYKSNTEFKKRLPEYVADSKNENSAKRIATDALELSNQFKFQEAHEQVDFAIILAQAINDTISKPTTYICKAQVFQDQGNYTEASLACEKAIKEAIIAKDRDVELQAIIKKGYCLFKISKYKEAEAVLIVAKSKLKIYRFVITREIYEKNNRKIYEHLSYIRYSVGEYDKSLLLLDTAIVINKSINSYEANINNAGFYNFIGQVKNKQGKPTEALTAFENAMEIYRNSNDVVNMALIANEMAFSFYKTGEYKRSIATAEWAMSRLIDAGDDNNAGYSKSLIGSSYLELGNYEAALSAHLKAIGLRKKGNNLSGLAFSWQKTGELYLKTGSKNLALQAFDTAAIYYKDSKDNVGVAEIYNKKGEVFLQDENYKKATEWFEKANGISNQSTVEALYQLGASFYDIDTVKARKYFEQAKINSKKDGNTSYQFFASRSLAMLAYNGQNTVQGNKWYEECVSLSSQLNTAIAQAYCFSLKAHRFETETELDSALLYYREAFRIFDTADRSLAISQLSNISSVHISKGEFQQADEALEKAISIARTISDSLSLGTTLQTTSFLYSCTADFQKGLNNNDSAISIFKKSGHKIRLASTYGSRGTLLSSMGENKQAVNAYLFADSLYKEELMQEQRGIIFNNIGTVYISQEDYSMALKYLQQALAQIKKGVVNENYLLTQGNIAECLKGLKRPAEAKVLLSDILPKAKQLKLSRAASGMALILGKILLDENKLQEAAINFIYAKDYAIASGEKEKTIDALINLARIYLKEKKTALAQATFQQSATLTTQYKIRGGWQAYYELGLIAYKQQQFDSAIVNFKEAVALLDKSAENLYGGEEAKKIFNNDPRKSDLYNKLTFSYYNAGNIKEAWAYANRSNIAGIKELSGTLSVNSSDEERNEALKKLLAMQQSKKALENTLEKQEGAAKQETIKKIEILEADYNNFLQDVVAQYPELSTYFSRSNADEFNNYKGKLPEDLAVALYLLNDKTLMIFTLTNEKLAVDTMTLDVAPKVASFIEVIKNTKKQTGTGSLAERSEPQDEEKSSAEVDFKDIANELYQALITTVTDKISNKKKLCIIPTGVFSNMPFQCLGKKVDGNDFQFLVEEYQIFYTNKMSVFNSPNQNNTARVSLSSFAAFGVPDATLQFNISEVKAIGKIIGSDSTVFTDARATESMAKQSLRNKKYVHFATHGILNYSSDYSQSYLKLLADKDTTDGNNGQLTMREVQKLGITNCEMVILSACQTAVTKQLVKGWNISPANSFLVSKVKSVVASLWKVADEPTGILMEYFYENLNRQMDKVEALRQAQIKLSQDPRFRHPNYWGAFVLYGEWR